MRTMVAAALSFGMSVATAARCFGADEGDTAPAQASGPSATEYVAPASDEAAKAMKGFALAPGWSVGLFAAEPKVANPTCLSIDDLGRVYVVETFRRRNEVLDTRKLPDWVDDDLACRTVADRIAMVKKRRPADWQTLAHLSDRVHELEDSDGDGHADKDTVFATGFNTLESGTAAGVLAWGRDVWFADIPNLWKLTDADHDGVAEKRESLYYGFGVRYNYSGHDFHGLRMGPDGRVYFSIADRGVHIEKDGKVLIDNPDSGCVMRCELDGSGLELVHTGLRNPQELAFDEYGNLFTCDNNSDAGDPSRWVYVVEGGDSAWRVGWQWIGGSSPRGPWLSEDLCQTQTRLPVYYRLPPIATPKIAGPSGLTYAPGVGLPADWQNRFLLVDFRGGTAGGSGVYALKNKPAGASFELEEVKPLVTGVLPSDVEFGIDGRVYFTDWVTGWEPTGKGRVYTLTPPDGGPGNLQVKASAALLGEFAKGAQSSSSKSPAAEQLPVDRLASLLAHPDVRVRMRAQFALAAHGAEGETALASVAATADATTLARCHAVWGLGQIARHAPGASAASRALIALLTDRDAEVRAQAAHAAGEAGDGNAVAPLQKMMGDRAARVQYFAAVALGRLRAAPAGDAVLSLLRKNNDKDAYLRHAGVMALTGMDAATIEKAAADASSAVRGGALLVYRRQRSEKVATFLDDVDPTLVLEAARAINDETIDAAMPKLAGLSGKTGLLEPVLQRVLNANFRLGSAATAQAVAAMASRNDLPAPVRVEAVQMLAEWKNPSGRDRVTSCWRPVPPRGDEPAKAALASVLDGLLKSAPDAVRIAALNAATAMGLNTTPLFDLVKDVKNPVGLRAAAVVAMAQKADPKLPDAAKVALAASEPQLRLAGLRVQLAVPGGSKTLQKVLGTGSPLEQQTVLQTAAAGLDDAATRKAAEDLLKSGFDRLEKGTLAAEAQLDLLDAITRQKKSKLADRLTAYEAGRQKQLSTDPLAAHRETLYGGDADRGAMIFRDRADVSCIRCHNIKGQGGNAGPDLSGLAQRAPGGPGKVRDYALESILYPARHVAPGWETVSIQKADGDVIDGVLKAENDQSVTLDVPNVGPQTIVKKEIKSRRGGQSGMPEDIAKTLSKQDLRDLVEFLARQ